MIMKSKKQLYLYAILGSIALIVPLFSYAGVTLIYPSSTTTVNVSSSPPITYASDTDYTTAANNGLAASFTTTNQGASYTVTVKGLSGGSMTADQWIKINAVTGVSQFTSQISSALTSTTGITSLKLRYWDSGLSSTAPTSDTANNVIGTIDLKAGTAGTSISFNSAYNTNAGATASTMATVAKTAAGVKVQLIVTLIDSSTANASVSLQPTGIVLT
jgi:hypothetical protein